MQTAGYSGKTLSEKLGLKPGTDAVVISPPDHYNELLGQEYQFIRAVTHVNQPTDFIHAFYTHEKDIANDFPSLVKNVKEKGMIWISWPKKSAKMESDLDENKIRQIGLKLGVVDIKVCAVDEIWSGLKFVHRKK